MAVRGSNAYRLPEEQRQVHVEPKKIQGGLTRKRRSSRIKTILAILTVTMVAFTAMMRYAEINVVNNKIQQLKQDLEASNTEVANLSIEVDRTIDLPTVENIATTRYGMVKPSNEQIIYITVTQGDQVDVVKKTGFTATLKSMFGF